MSCPHDGAPAWVCDESGCRLLPETVDLDQRRATQAFAIQDPFITVEVVSVGPGRSAHRVTHDDTVSAGWVAKKLRQIADELDAAEDDP